MSILDPLLPLLAKPLDASATGATAGYNLENCLDFPKKAIPEFESLLRGKSVVDYGCGHGWQAVAMYQQSGASSVLALDVNDGFLAHGRELADKHGCAQFVRFASAPPPDTTYEIVVSISAFEHFVKPELELRRMSHLTAPGGRILLAFAEPWYSHSGSHVGGWTRIPGTGREVPWANLLFSERALLRLRERYREDRPARFEEIEGGLNRMSVARFEREMRSSGMQIESMQLLATAGLPLVTRVPVMRELLTSAASAVLIRPSVAT